MKLKDYLSSLGLSEKLLQAIPDYVELPETKKRPRSGRGPTIRPKSRVEGFYFRAGISTYKVVCPHCGKKVWASYTCPHCGKCMEAPKEDPVPIQKARDLKRARELAHKWGYEVVKKKK